MWGYLGAFVLGFAACGWLIALDEMVTRALSWTEDD